MKGISERLWRTAKVLGEGKASALLDENLKQEKDALKEIGKVATRFSKEGA